MVEFLIHVSLRLTRAQSSVSMGYHHVCIFILKADQQTIDVWDIQDLDGISEEVSKRRDARIALTKYTPAILSSWVFECA